VFAATSACHSAQPLYPGYLNLASGEIHPIIELAGCEDGPQGLHAILQGHRVRTAAAANDCVPLFSEASATSHVLGCFADGVFLRVRDGSFVLSAGWLPVSSPDGTMAGWVQTRRLAP
jgi:hypothetical protein